MWAGYLALILFGVAVSCVFAAIWKHDGPMWAALFVAVLLCAAMMF
jgi:hypothetical protein